MYLHSFSATNFLSHRNTTVELSPITVFVGPNAGGKSALFDAIVNFSMVARGNIRQAFGPFPFSYAATKHHGSPKFENIRFEATVSEKADDQEKLRYSIDYQQESAAESAVHTLPSRMNC